MKKKSLFLVKFMIIVMCISLLNVGCTSKNQPKKEMQGIEDKARTQLSDDRRREDTVRDDRRREDTTRSKKDDKNIPKSLKDIEDDIEDISEDIYKQDWNKASKRLSLIEKNWGTYKPEARNSKVSEEHIKIFEEHLKNLKTQIQAKKQYNSALLASKLEMAVTDFKDSYGLREPIALEKLEIYAKRILLTSQNADWKQTEEDIKLAMDSWNSIKSHAHNINSANAKKVDDTLNEISKEVKARNGGRMRELTNRLDDEVDRLEDDFER